MLSLESENPIGFCQRCCDTAKNLRSVNDVVICNNYELVHQKFYLPINLKTQHGNTSLEMQEQYQYGQQANIREITGRDGVTTTYLWGYNSQHLVAEIRNCTFNEITSKISESYIQSMSKSASLGLQDMFYLTSLRTWFPQAQVTIYTYKPLVGMTSKIDPRGVTTYYEYDGFGRLKRSYIIENDVQKTLETYDYHYKTP